VLCAALVFGVTMLLSRGGFGGASNYKMAKKLAVVKQVVDENYIGDADDDALTNAAAAAIVTATGDRWSYYMTPDEYQAYQMYSANEYAGIGVTLQAGAGSNGLQIVAVAAQSPAEKAGLQVGEAILEAYPEATVDVHDPEIQLNIEIRERIYLYSHILEGPGGLPIGTAGKAMLLLSGGIDSPVAGYM
jgi:C-terminal processing protease CtpA/Prc